MSAEQINSATNAAAAQAASGGKPTVVSVFVGDLDPTVGEDQLLETFRGSGPIISVRVCRDIITRKSLGYGYVNFQNHADAERAINTMNFTQIGGRKVRLMWQQRDPALRISGQGNLFVRNLDGSTDHKSLVELFAGYGPILSAKVIADGEGKCRGYGFVHFKDENSASQALAKMNGKQVEGWSNPLYVANFIRRNARIAFLVQNFTNIYIKHLLPTASKDEIEKFFSKFGNVTSAVAKQDSKGRLFAFCNFAKHADAVKAIDELNDKDIDGLTSEGEHLFVARAQHRAERMIELRQKYLQRQSRGNNLYIRNFDPSYTDDNLRELFKGYGDIKSCKVMVDIKGYPRGFGFVSFATAEEANLALREMNGRMLNGKPLVVNIAQRRDHRLSMLQVQFHQRLQNMIQGAGHMLNPSMFYSTARNFLAGGNQAAAMAPSSGSQGFVMAGGQQMVFMPGAANRTMLTSGGQQQQQQQQPKQGSGGKKHGRQSNNSNKQQQQHNQPHVAAATAATAIPPPAQGTLTMDELMAMPVDDRKRTLGERLFPAVLTADVPEELCPKITGMLLELDVADGLSLLTDSKKLKEKIDEALCVLKQSASM